MKRCLVILLLGLLTRGAMAEGEAQVVSPSAHATVAAPAPEVFMLSDYELTPFRDRRLYLLGHGNWADSGMQGNPNPYPTFDWNSQAGQNTGLSGNLFYDAFYESKDRIVELNWQFGISTNHNSQYRLWTYLVGPNLLQDWRQDNFDGVDGNFQLGIRRTRYLPKGFASFLISAQFNPSYSETLSESRVRTIDSNGAIVFEAASNSEQANYYHNVLASLGGELGQGRLIDTYWAWRALALLGELEKKGVLLRPANTEDVQALAGRMAELTQSYPWDSREKAKQEISGITAVLTEIGLLGAVSVPAFVEISDSRLYLVSERLRGWVYGLSPNIEYRNNFYHYYSVIGNSSSLFERVDLWGTPKGTLTLRWEWQQPLSRDFQRNAKAQFIAATPYLVGLNQISNIELQEDFRFSASTAWEWYPDTRSSLSASIGVNARHWRIYFPALSYLPSWARRLDLDRQVSTFVSLSYQRQWIDGLTWTVSGRLDANRRWLEDVNGAWLQNLSGAEQQYLSRYPASTPEDSIDFRIDSSVSYRLF